MQAHPLQGKIDLNRILIVGHSRCGEGIRHASLSNRLTSIKPDIFQSGGPSGWLSRAWSPRFGFTAAAAIAPTDRNNLAALYYNQQQYEKAEPLFQRSLKIWDKTLGPAPDVAKN